MRRRFQHGTIVNRNGVPTGMWREYVTLPDGSQRSVKKAKAFPGMSERAARAALQPILDAINKANVSPKLVEKSELLLNDIISEWRRMVAPNQKPRGRRSAESHLRAHIVPMLGTTPVSKLDAKIIQGFVADITPGRSGKTVLNIVVTLSGILGHARKWHQNIPTVKLADLSLPEKVKATPKFYQVAEIKRLIKAAPEPLRTILLVLVMTGMRINEALALCLDDLDFDNKIIHVRHSADYGKLGTPKSAASAADVAMPDELEKAIRDFMGSDSYRKNLTGLLFANRNDRPYSDNKLREYALRPLLRSLKMYSKGKVFHAIRHTAGSIMLESGASIINVQKQLRHSSPTVTLNVYGHVLGDSQRQAASKLASLVA
jgi:integrase